MVGTVAVVINISSVVTVVVGGKIVVVVVVVWVVVVNGVVVGVVVALTSSKNKSGPVVKLGNISKKVLFSEGLWDLFSIRSSSGSSVGICLKS